jgi:hypothetical protein
MLSVAVRAEGAGVAVNLIRAYRIARNRREYDPPAGTTHVLEFIPAWNLYPEPDGGAWSLQSLDNWLAGTPNGDYPLIDGASSMTEGDFGQCPILDTACYLVRFETEVITDDRAETVPAWWIEVTS